MEKIKIGNFRIGCGEPTFIIAEAGINHDGKYSRAKELVEMAVKTGADAVKFQIFRAEEFCNENTDDYDLFSSLELSIDNWFDLAGFAEDQGIIFTASVFGEESADILNEVNAPVYKIASGDLTHLPLLDYISKKNKSIILSTGMSTIGEIDESLNKIYNSGNHKVALMHCVSNYPTNYKDTNLKFIQTLKDVFKIPIGFSDHTKGALVPALAVANGAQLIEKHFTIDKNLPGPDHELSLEPDEFKEMVKNIRIAECSLGNGIKNLTEEEKHTKNLARRGITAKIDILKGDTITEDKIKIVRPAIGLEPKFFELVVGKTVNIDVVKNQAITWNLLC